MNSESNRRPFKILSLDGGGIRGAFSAAFLAEIEHTSGKRISEHFDLFAGTSTGGIIALALAFDEPAARILEFYRRHGPSIFHRSIFAKTVRWMKWFDCLRDVSLLRSAYRPRALMKGLEEFFGNRRIVEASRRLVVPAIDLCRGQTIVFKTPHFPGLHRDGKFRAADVALATSAAPTFFPAHTIENGSLYIDGGLWANNPAMIAVVEALKIGRESAVVDAPGYPKLDDIRLAAVGTGRRATFVEAKRRLDGGIFWMRPLLDLIGLSQSQGVDFQCGYLLANENVLRVNFDIPEKSFKLDGINHLDHLIHIGRETAARHARDFIRQFLSDTRPKMVFGCDGPDMTENSTNDSAQ